RWSCAPTSTGSRAAVDRHCGLTPILASNRDPGARQHSQGNPIRNWSPEGVSAFGADTGRADSHSSRKSRYRGPLGPRRRLAQGGIPMGTKAKLSLGALLGAAAFAVGAIYAIITESPQSPPPQTSVGAPSAAQTGARPESPSSTATAPAHPPLATVPPSQAPAPPTPPSPTASAPATQPAMTAEPSQATAPSAQPPRVATVPATPSETAASSPPAVTAASEGTAQPTTPGMPAAPSAPNATSPAVRAQPSRADAPSLPASSAATETASPPVE